VFPVPPNTRASYLSKGSNGERWGCTRDPDKVREYWTRFPTAGIGLPMEENNLVTVDADTAEGHVRGGGPEAMAALEAQHGALPDTLRARTPSGGRHWVFNRPAGVTVINASGVPVDGIDIRGDGGMIVIAPTKRKGKAYTWENLGVKIADVPPWLLELITLRPRGSSGRPAFGSNYEPMSDEKLEACVKAIKNPADLGRDAWTKIAMAIYSADSGDLGFRLFDDFSKRWEKPNGYDPEATQQKWRQLQGSPPSRVTVGTLIMLANQDSPGWNPSHPRGSGAVPGAPEDQAEILPAKLALTDFWADHEGHRYIYAGTNRGFSATVVDNYFGKVKAGEDAEGEPIMVRASVWLDNNRSVQQVLWAPGEPMIIQEKHLLSGGWVEAKDKRAFNMYQPRRTVSWQGRSAQRWVDHVHRLYPNEADRIIQTFAYKVQNPGAKVNHALVFLGDQGIGKDTLIEPMRHAVGSWNFVEISPHDIQSAYNGYFQNVVVLINEIRDLGDINRPQFYERTKVLIAAPPSTILVNEKYIPHRSVLNCCLVLMTTNDKASLWLPPSDRRHYVLDSLVMRGDIEDGYFEGIWEWYRTGGLEDVAEYLETLDVSSFSPYIPPPQTQAFWEIVQDSTPSEGAELAGLLMQIGDPKVVTRDMIIEATNGNPVFQSIQVWLEDRKNLRLFPSRMDTAGYARVRNPNKADGLWPLPGSSRGVVVYAKKELSREERAAAIAGLAGPGSAAHN
jgi:hypothetical protein